MKQIPYLIKDQCFFLDKQVLHRMIEAIQVTCFGISRRPCLCWTLSCRRKITYQLLLIGLFHKLISMQNVGHNMLHLHAAQQLSSFKQSKFIHQWVISPPNDNDAELKISIWHFSKQNIVRLTQVKNEGREVWRSMVFGGYQANFKLLYYFFTRRFRPNKNVQKHTKTWFELGLKLELGLVPSKYHTTDVCSYRLTYGCFLCTDLFLFVTIGKNLFFLMRTFWISFFMRIFLNLLFFMTTLFHPWESIF